VQAESQVAAIGHVIQLAITPVFLFTGVSGLLAVLINRLARIIDRARILEGRLRDMPEPGDEDMHAGLTLLSRRARLINRAVTLCTVCALLICSVIITLFAGAFLKSDASVVIGLLFIAAVLALMSGLANFLREIYIATRNLRIGVR